MKSNIVNTRRILECDCEMPNHLLVVDVLEDKDKPIYAEITFLSNYKMPWYKRLWYSILFVLFRKGFYPNDTVLISESNIKDFEEIVQMFKGKT